MSWHPTPVPRIIVGRMSGRRKEVDGIQCVEVVNEDTGAPEYLRAMFVAWARHLGDMSRRDKVLMRYCATPGGGTWRLVGWYHDEAEDENT